MDFDTNVENYTNEELLQLLDLTDTSNESVIIATQQEIDKHEDNKEIVNFYLDIRNRLVQPEETTKVFEATVKKGTINPDLKNTVSRMINVDSSYRDISITNLVDSDNYVFTLNEPINNVTSLTLYSVEIPQSWYTFAATKGNTQLKIVLVQYTDDNTSFNNLEYPIITIKDGNYTTKSLLLHLKSLLAENNIFVNQADNSFDIVQDPYTGKFNFVINSNFNFRYMLLPGIDPADVVDSSGVIIPPIPSYPPSPAVDPYYVPYYKFKLPATFKVYNYKLSFIFHNQTDLNNKINYNLGWILGFRLPAVIMEDPINGFDGGITNKESKIIFIPYSLIDTAGTKYIILKLDDYKSNRLNNGLVCINVKKEKSIRPPSYYNTTLSKFTTSKNTVNVLPSAPNNLTAKQIYTINSIADDKLYQNTTINSQRVKFPEDSDIFAKIPIKRVTEWGAVDSEGNYTAIDNGPGKLIIEFSGPIQLNSREYFGPVNMTSFAVSLYDDKGMLLGLNGLDWSFTVIAKSIYQY